MKTIVAIAGSSATRMTKKKMISSKEMMTITTIISSSKTMTTIWTMTSNKKKLITVTIVSSSDIMTTTIKNEKIITFVTVVCSKEAIDDNADNDWK